MLIGYVGVSRMLKQRYNGGFSLIELMIAVAASGFLMLGLVALFIANNLHSKQTLLNAKVEMMAQAATTLMERDIASAGYWGNAGSSSTNPFMQDGTTDVYISADAQCILLAYDKNNDGQLPAISSSYDDERYGYRLQNNAIQYRPWGASFDCSAPNNAWVNLTDPNTMQVSSLRFNMSENSIDIDGAGPGTSILVSRIVTINTNIGRINASGVYKTYIRLVRLRNDKYSP